MGPTIFILYIIYGLVWVVGYFTTNCENKIWFIHNWNELCIGIYWNEDKRALYIFPLPFYGMKVNFSRGIDGI